MLRSDLDETRSVCGIGKPLAWLAPTVASLQSLILEAGERLLEDDRARGEVDSTPLSDRIIVALDDVLERRLDQRRTLLLGPRLAKARPAKARPTYPPPTWMWRAR